MPYPWQQWQPVLPDPSLFAGPGGPPARPPVGLLGLLSPQDIQNIPMQTQAANAPPGPASLSTKPSILDRLLGRLFPTPGGLGQEAQHQIQRQGLLSLGANLMAAGGPRPYRGSTLANIGSAM